MGLTQELQEFIRRLRIAEDESRRMRQDLIAIRQNLRDADDTGIRAKLARISGEVDGCASAGFPGAVVAIYHHDTGVKLGELTCDADGLYEGRVGLDSDPQDVDIVATPTGTYAARFAGPVVSPATLSVGANPVPAIVIPPTEDWCCGETDYFPGDCGPPPPCETGRICVTVQSTGCAARLTGVTITVTDDASPPNVIGTAATVGGVSGVTLTNSGSGYTDGSGYALGISGDGTGATGTFDVVAGKITNIVITNPGAGYSSATISFPGAGGGSGATAAATIKGMACIALPHAGTYHVTSHIPFTTDQTATVNAVCGIDNHVTLEYPGSWVGLLTLEAHSCDGFLAGATFTLDGVTSPPTDSTGHATMACGVGNVTPLYTDTNGANWVVTPPIPIAACQATMRRVETVQRTKLNFIINGPPCCSCHLTVKEHATGFILCELDVATVWNPGLFVCVATMPVTPFTKAVESHYQLVDVIVEFPNKTFVYGPMNIDCGGGLSGLDPDPGKTLC